MPTFAGIACDFLRGIPEPLYQRIVSYETPGVDGTGYHFQGFRGEPYQLRLVQFGTLAEVTNWINAIRAAHGTTVTYTDDFDLASQLCFVESVGRPQITPAYPHDKRAEIMVSVRAIG